MPCIFFANSQFVGVRTRYKKSLDGCDFIGFGWKNVTHDSSCNNQFQQTAHREVFHQCFRRCSHYYRRGIRNNRQCPTLNLIPRFQRYRDSPATSHWTRICRISWYARLKDTRAATLPNICLDGRSTLESRHCYTHSTYRSGQRLNIWEVAHTHRYTRWYDYFVDAYGWGLISRPKAFQSWSVDGSRFPEEKG